MDNFDSDSRTILVEYDPHAYILRQLLEGMPSWCPLIGKDGIIKSLHDAMRIRVSELLPAPGEAVEAFVTCGFSCVK